MISLASLLDDQRQIEVSFPNNETVKLTYTPAKVTPEWAIRVNNEPGVSPAVAYLSDVVRSWDLGGPLYDGGGEQVVAIGEAVPVDREFIRFIPSIVSTFLVDAIDADVRTMLPGGTGKRDPKSRMA